MYQQTSHHLTPITDGLVLNPQGSESQATLGKNTDWLDRELGIDSDWPCYLLP